MNLFLFSPFFGITLTLLVFYLSQKIYARYRFFFFNPVLLSVIAIISLLKISGIEYSAYNEGGKVISIFLGPAVIALGILLYEKSREISSAVFPILLSVISGSILGTMGTIAILIYFKCPPEIVASVAPKSVTSPIAMGISEKLHGIPVLSVALSIITGLLGAVLGPSFLKMIKVKSAKAFGLAMGTASHGIGTARAVEAGETQGALSGLAICLHGIFASLLIPFLIRLSDWIMN